MRYEGLKQTNNILLFVIAALFLLYMGSTFFIPFTFGVFFATLMAPFSNFLEKWKFKRTISSLISTLVILVVIGVLAYLFLYQLISLAKDLPAIRSALQQFLVSLQHQIYTGTGFSFEEQNKLLQNRSESLVVALEFYLTRILGSIIDTAVKFLLVLIYVFLLLLYRTKFSAFIMMYTNKGKELETGRVLEKIGNVTYQYLWGRVQVMAILAIMYYFTFIIFDIRYAILLTIFGALITVIPYIGPFISGLAPIVFAIIFGKGFYDVLLFSCIIMVIQLIESYVLEPIIIGKEVELNPLTVIIAVIIGGMVWGVAGMVLFVPIFAMIKIISNNRENLKPLGYLLGTAEKVG